MKQGHATRPLRVALRSLTPFVADPKGTGRVLLVFQPADLRELAEHFVNEGHGAGGQAIMSRTLDAEP